jgi:hypothetical protein
VYFVVLGVDEHRIDSYNRIAVFLEFFETGEARPNTIFTSIVIDGLSTLACGLPGEFFGAMDQEGFE